MSQEVFNQLNDRGVIQSIVYVCGWGWTIPSVVIYGSGSGSGSGCCNCLECHYYNCDCTSSGSGASCDCSCEYCGDNSGCSCFMCFYNKCDCINSSGGSGSGSGSDSRCSCSCSCDFCGVGSGWDAGNIDMYEAVIRDEIIGKGLKEMLREMLDIAIMGRRQEIGCYIYYNVKKKKYYTGTMKYGMKVSSVLDVLIDLESPDPIKNGVEKDCILVVSCHANTTLEHESNEKLRRSTGFLSGTEII